jgi:hypothetical protein
MAKYSEEFKLSIIKQMMPPQNKAVSKTAGQELCPILNNRSILCGYCIYRNRKGTGRRDTLAGNDHI